MKWTSEHNVWLLDNHKNKKHTELIQLFNKKFNCEVTYSIMWKKLFTLGLTTRQVNMSNRAPANKWVTEEMLSWLKNNYRNYDTKHLLYRGFSEHYNLDITKSSFCSIIYNYNLNITFKYTKEEIAWLRRNVPNTLFKDVTVMFNNKFNRNRTYCSIKYICSIHGIKNNLNSRAYSDKISIAMTKPVGYIYINKNKDRCTYKLSKDNPYYASPYVSIPYSIVVHNNNQLCEAYINNKINSKLLKESFINISQDANRKQRWIHD